MKKIETTLQDCFVIEPNVYHDSRGFFFESFNQKVFENIITNLHFVQDNIVRSQYGAVRGLHMQNPPYSQAKLIQVLEGKIIDAVIDVRKNSPTFGKSFQIELNSENKLQLFVPKGFLHGYSVLSETALVMYKCDDFYHKESENGIHPLDQTIAIDWKIPAEHIILSDKDKQAKSFTELEAVIL